MELFTRTALEIANAVKTKQITVREVISAFLDNVKQKDGAYHCFNTLCEAEALRRADEVQAGIDAGVYSSPLAGVPIGIKDNICTKNIKTTCSSKMLENFIPPYNATVIERLESAGLIVIGKTNMDEFAMGSTTETSFTGATRNPWNTERVPGGSSGGSAAAVAAGLVPIALGSDTGGSVRQPCSFCGVSGLKPTYGAVSRCGLIAYASSLDQIGPIGKNAEDCAALFSVICGKDEKDSTSMDFPAFDFSAAANGSMKGKKIGIPAEFLGEGIAPDVKNAVLSAAEVYRTLGAEVEAFPMPLTKYAVPAYYILASAEASSNLARYDGVKYGYCARDARSLEETYIKSRSEGFGAEAKRRILLGNFVLSAGYYDAYYLKALKTKRLIQDAFSEAFRKYDILLSPVAPETAPKIGESLSDPLKMYLSDICTVMVNLAGLPAVSAPCGFDKGGMPVGFQLIGKPFCEAALLSAARAFESVTDYHTRYPKIQ